jgi:hypothetical protein
VMSLWLLVMSFWLLAMSLWLCRWCHCDCADDVYFVKVILWSVFVWMFCAVVRFV